MSDPLLTREQIREQMAKKTAQLGRLTQEAAQKDAARMGILLGTATPPEQNTTQPTAPQED